MELDLINRLIEEFGFNEPILFSEIQSIWSEYSRPRIFQLLKKYMDKDLLCKFDTGVYYIPKITILGELSALNPQKVIEKKFIKNNNDVFGYYTGLKVLNELGLTTQVPAVYEVVTEKETTRIRTVNVGKQRVILRRAKVDITKDNAPVLQLLDACDSIYEPLGISQFNNIKTFIKNNSITLDSMLQYSKFYPSKTLSNFIDKGLKRIFDEDIDTDVYQKEIPKTSVANYISGRHALNIPDKTSGDWHFSTVWFSSIPEKIELWGKKGRIDTTPLFGVFGIIEKKKSLEKVGLKTPYEKVYVANHYRAILDLVVAGALNGNMSLVTGATMDYLDTQKQKEYLLAKIKKIIADADLRDNVKTHISKWLAKEGRDIYRGEVYL